LLGSVVGELFDVLGDVSRLIGRLVSQPAELVILVDVRGAPTAWLRGDRSYSNGNNVAGHASAHARALPEPARTAGVLSGYVAGSLTQAHTNVHLDRTRPWKVPMAKAEAASRKRAL